MQVRSADHTGRQEVVRLEVREFETEAECSFEFRKQRFCWDAEDNGFHKLRCPTKVWLSSSQMRGVPDRQASLALPPLGGASLC